MQECFAGELEAYRSLHKCFSVYGTHCSYTATANTASRTQLAWEKFSDVVMLTCAERFFGLRSLLTNVTSAACLPMFCVEVILPTA